jgi:hypothetical protein
VRIQRYPQGLLALLDAKSTGVTPVETLDKVQPGIDLNEFYFASIESTGAQAAQLGVSGVNTMYAIVTVPQGEFWKVLGVNATLTNASAAIATISGSVAVGNAVARVSVAKFVNEPLAAAADIVYAAWNPPENTDMFGPGSTFGTVFDQALGLVTVDCYTTLLYRKMTV